MGTGLTTPGMRQARLQPPYVRQAGTSGKSDHVADPKGLAYRRADGHCRRFYRPTSHFVQCPPAGPRRLWVVLPRAPLPVNRGNPASAPQIAPPGSLAIDGLRRHFLEGR